MLYSEILEKYKDKKIALDEHLHQFLIPNIPRISLELGIEEKFIVLSVHNPEFELYSKDVLLAYLSLTKPSTSRIYTHVEKDLLRYNYFLGLLTGMLVRNFHKSVVMNFSEFSDLTEPLSFKNLFIKRLPAFQHSKLNDDMYTLHKVLSSRKHNQKITLMFSSDEEKEFITNSHHLRTFYRHFYPLIK